MEYTLKSGLVMSDFDVDDIDTRDYPDFCDAYICNAYVKENGECRDATPDELDEVNDDSDFVYDLVLDQVF